jgi:hypothetical protein
LAEQIGGNNEPDFLAWSIYGYGFLGQSDDAQRVFEDLRNLAAEQYVGSMLWVWAYIGVGEYDEALSRFNAATENLETIKRGTMADRIRQNIWSDPMLEQPEWLAARNRFAFRR